MCLFASVMQYLGSGTLSANQEVTMPSPQYTTAPTVVPAGADEDPDILLVR